MVILRFPAKRLRADVIADYVLAAGYEGVVVFGSGNGAKELKRLLPNVLDISPSGDLAPTTWWSPANIARTWPRHFDATSGHLPLWLMQKVGDRFRAHLGEFEDWNTRGVPSGSGETVVCLKLAYPDVDFVALYGSGPHDQFDDQAPLNQTVRALVKVEGLQPKGGRNQ